MTENKILQNRHEIVFMYDVRDANPNGDPDNSNMPRIDDATDENLVTDVRLKRTVRDYWLAKDRKVLIRAETNEEGNRKTMDDLATEFLDLGKITKKNAGEARKKLANEMPQEYIDVRTFGAAVTLSKANYSLTGTAQFGLGRSLNIPMIQTKTITSTLASTEAKGAGAIGEYHIVDYSLIKFHGIISEINAQETGYNDEDLTALFNGLWAGTKQLNTRSKFNHVPRLLIDIESAQGKSQIGDLDLCFELTKKEGIKSIDQVVLNISEFIERIEQFQDNIDSLNLKHSTDLKLVNDTEEIKDLKDYLSNKFPKINVNELDIEGE